MKALKTLAVGLALAAVAGQANAACTWGQNTVVVRNETSVAPLFIPAKTHARWRVADSASEWIDVPRGGPPVQRVYGSDYPVMVDISMFTGLEWFTLGSADILAAVRAGQAAYGGECAAAPSTTVVPMTTVVVVTLSDGVAGKGVISVKSEPSD